MPATHVICMMGQNPRQQHRQAANTTSSQSSQSSSSSSSSTTAPDASSSSTIAPGKTQKQPKSKRPPHRSPCSCSCSTSTSSTHPQIPKEITRFFTTHLRSITLPIFEARCNAYLTSTINGIPPGLPKHWWKTLLKEHPGVSKRIAKKRTKRDVVNTNVVKINVHDQGTVGRIVGISGIAGSEDGGGEGEEEEEQEEEEGEVDVNVNENTPAIPEEDTILDLNTCDKATREATLVRFPTLPAAPASYTLPASHFPRASPCTSIPDHLPPLPPPGYCPSTLFHFRYIRNALQNLLHLRQKFLQPSWSPEIKEGWYDSNLWPYFIDYLFCRSSTLSLLRKELAIIPGNQGEGERGGERYDGVVRCIRKGMRFDLGVVEVSRLSDRPNRDVKAVVDRRKILKALKGLLGWLRKRVDDHHDDVEDGGALVVVGMLCTGWSVTLFRMCYIQELGYVVDQQHFAIEWDEDFFENLKIMEALVRHVEAMEHTANVIIANGRMVN